MGDENEIDETEEVDETEENNKPGKTFTQEELDKIVGRERGQGRKAARNELLKELGFENMEEAKGLMEQLRAAGDANLEEHERIRKAGERAQAEAKEALESAKRLKHDALVERRLLKANVDPDQTEMVAKLIEVELGSDAEDIDSAIEDLMDKMPQVFAAPGSEDEGEESESESQGRRPVHTDPGRSKAKKQKTSPSERANSRLQQRHGSRLKNTTKE